MATDVPDPNFKTPTSTRDLLLSSMSNTPSRIRDVLEGYVEYALAHRIIITVGYAPSKTGNEESSDSDSDEETPEYDSDEEEDIYSPPYVFAKFACDDPPPDLFDDEMTFDEMDDDASDDDESDGDDSDSEPRGASSQTKTSLVRQRISVELKDAAEKIEKILAANIKRGKIQDAPTPEFLALCREAIFVFNAPGALRFLEKLSPQIGETICQAVITAELLYADDNPSREAWLKPGNKKKKLSPFAAALKGLVNLKDIGIYLPPNTADYYCSSAPQEIYGFLASGKIDIMRVFFREMMPQDFDILQHHYLADERFRDGRWLRNGIDPNLVVISREPGEPDPVGIRRKYGWTKVVSAFTIRRNGDPVAGAQGGA